MDDIRTEKLNRVKLVEKEKDELEKPKNEALVYLRLANEIVHKKNMGFNHYVLDNERRLEKTKKKKEKFEEDAKEVLEKLKAIHDKRKSKEEKFQKVGVKRVYDNAIIFCNTTSGFFMYSETPI